MCEPQSGRVKVLSGSREFESGRVDSLSALQKLSIRQGRRAIRQGENLIRI
jgi:hypothetical protein